MRHGEPSQVQPTKKPLLKAIARLQTQVDRTPFLLASFKDAGLFKKKRSASGRDR